MSPEAAAPASRLKVTSQVLEGAGTRVGSITSQTPMFCTVSPPSPLEQGLSGGPITSPTGSVAPVPLLLLLLQPRVTNAAADRRDARMIQRGDGFVMSSPWVARSYARSAPRELDNIFAAARWPPSTNVTIDL